MAEFTENDPMLRAFGPFVEEKMVQTTNKIMALTAELRVGAETAAEMLQEFGNYIVDIVNKGTLFLRKQYDESTIQRLDEFIPPEDFNTLIKTLQWQPQEGNESAIKLCNFETTYTFLKPIDETRPSILQCITRLRRLAAEDPPRWEPYQLDNEEDNDNEKRSKGKGRHERPAPGPEKEGIVAWDDFSTVTGKLQSVISQCLEPAHKRISDALVPWIYEISQMDDFIVTSYHEGGEDDRAKLLQSMFDKAMADDKQHLHADTYEREMRDIRALQMLPSIEQLENRLMQLDKVISLVKELLLKRLYA